MPAVSSLLDTTKENEQTLNTTGESSRTTKVSNVKKVVEKRLTKPLEPKVMKSKDFDLEIAQLVYRGVESILEKDEFDIFATKSKKIFDLKITKINTDIEKMIKLNVNAKADEKKFLTGLAKLKKENDKKIAVLREKLL